MAPARPAPARPAPSSPTVTAVAPCRPCGLLRQLRTLAVMALAGMALALAGCFSTGSLRTAVPVDEARALRLVDDHGGHERTLAATLQAAPVTALVFWSAQCPCVRRYQGRIDAFAARWQAQGAQVLAVASNPDESARDLARARRDRGVTTALWRDPGGAVAASLGVRTTPTVVILRRDGTVAYHGWLDNEREPDDPTRRAWADAAMTRTLAATAAPLEQRPVWGCRIPRALAGAPAQAQVPQGSAAPATPGTSPCGCQARGDDDAPRSDASPSPSAR